MTTIERNHDSDATVELPGPVIGEELEDIDPEKTVVREDWEAAVMRRVAPRIAAVQGEIEADEERFGWESKGLRRLSRELQVKRENQEL